MKIEEAIQQSVFRNEKERALVNLSYSASRVQLKMNETLKVHGISAPQFNALRILRGQHPKPASVKLVMERMLDVSSNASRLIDKLVEKNLVERRTCENDRRQVDVLITPSGLKLVKVAISDTNKLIDSIKVKESDAKAFNDVLDQLRNQITES